MPFVAEPCGDRRTVAHINTEAITGELADRMGQLERRGHNVDDAFVQRVHGAQEQAARLSLDGRACSVLLLKGGVRLSRW
ncbi:hypothetical protein [Sphingomonas sp. CCH5-D11]|uniref:hypothetical protein n=1 Tax=Sphingomonas sp. CCH5-D11 TaxID=1768786 RepID=UPI00082BC3C6|nr:hypothetical protein [Sphingomonas sp. CCH5-D11]